jgi:predicted alpha/beta hydrolase
MARAQTLLVRSHDGAESEAKLFADGMVPELVVVLMPAMGVPARFYEPLADALARRGHASVIGELRGVGSSSVRARRGVEFGYHEHVRYDLPALLSVARGRFPSARFVIAGHSLGGHLGAMYASVHPSEIDRLVLLASGTPYHASFGFAGSVGMRGVAFVARGLSNVLGYFPGRRIGFGGNEARRYMHEWCELADNGQFRVAGDDDFEARLREVSLPILAISFSGDSFAPQRSVDHLLSKMPRANATRVRMSAAELGTDKLDHFRWARYPEPIADVIARWLGETPEAA